jgi:DNA helicase HerA-like ATPase
MFEASSAEEAGNYFGVKCFLDAQDFTSKHTIITSVAGAGKTNASKLLIKEMAGKTSIQIILFDPYNEYSSFLNTFAKTTELNSKMDKVALTKEIKKGQITILNGYGLSLEEKRSFYVEFLQLLMKLKLEEKIKPLILVIEEAENLKGEVLNRVVVEGRKTGIFVWLLTTHPADLGRKILSQIGNQLIGKTTDKEDIEYLVNMAGPANVLPGLAIGEWIINRISVNRPMKMRMNDLT